METSKVKKRFKITVTRILSAKAILILRNRKHGGVLNLLEIKETLPIPKTYGFKSQMEQLKYRLNMKIMIVITLSIFPRSTIKLKELLSLSLSMGITTQLKL